MRISPLLFAAISVALCGAVHADTVTFIPLTTPDAQLTKISGDGKYAASMIFQTAAVRWTAATGVEELIPELNAGLGINNSGTIAGSIPENGGSEAGGRDLGAYAQVGSPPVLLSNPLSTNASGYDISEDGTVVGLSFEDEFAGTAVAFKWTAADGMTAMQVNRPLNSSRANAISADGRVIVGWNDEDDGWRAAVIWTDGLPFEPLGDDGLTLDEATSVSNNGQFVVGANYWDADGNGASWRWDAKNGVVRIPGMVFAFGVSNDGKTIVGSNDFFSEPARAAMIWREGIGSMMLTDYLAENGVTIPEGWDPDLAGGFGAISADGLTMGGWTIGTDSLISYIIKVTPDEDENIFTDGFDGPATP